MTPRQLRYFVAIARAGNISQAAAVLHVAQPSLSQHMAAIEDELGVPLLERHARGVTLTPAGQRLFDRACSILRQLDHLPDDVAAATGLPRGEVRLAMDGSIAALVIAPLYRAMEARYPDVRVSVLTGLSHQMLQLVQTRSVDLALMPNAFELPSLLSEPVYEERFCLFGASGSFPPQLRQIRFDDIGDRPLVATDRQHDQRKLIERVADARKRTLNVRYEINDAELTRALVQSGLAQAILPSNAFAATSLRNGVRALEIVEPVLHRIQSVAWPSGTPLTPAAEATRQCLHDTVAALIDARALRGRLPRVDRHREEPIP
ncbi:MAG: LysR family transcriptional regulator [Pigmentiphaga sp.]|uniref:LysR family transcriptional regulator n=1 Tax=Pigmentiphaga sp. TaxID=1977564 RepID=UPI0029A5AB49|nr:LysR family transcriptional regulator [Pigmentiphaga sp.]MDX3905523.1 LysR family transcriptional regulator [Pigmentiphaga sp.]